MNALRPIDHAALRMNQAVIIVLLVTGFILNSPWLVGLVALFMLGGTILGKPGFFFLYSRIFRPAGLVKPDILQDNPEPHRFAQGLGGTVLVAALLSLLAGAFTLGWTLNWLVIALAALNLFGGFCAGCAVYYWLGRLHVPGFIKTPPAGTFPGLRPHRTQAQAGDNHS